MKRIALALMALMMACSTACADMHLFVARDTIDGEAARGVASLLEQTVGQTWTPVCEEETGESLAQMILGDRAPQLAIVPVQQAAPWAAQGVLLGLDGYAAYTAPPQEAVMDCCTREESLFAAPLFVHQRSMAVNARMVEEAGFDYLLNVWAHPVWYPSEMVQVMEEIAMDGFPAMDIWPDDGPGGASMEALVRGVGGITDGETPDDGTPEAKERKLAHALMWTDTLLRGEIIAVAQSRQEALERFLAEETAFFIDWTPREHALYAGGQAALDIRQMPLPGAGGQAAYVGDVVCVCAPEGWDAQANVVAKRAVSVLTGAQGDALFAPRGMAGGGRLMIASPDAASCGATARTLLLQALSAVAGGGDPQEIARRIVLALEAAQPQGR